MVLNKHEISLKPDQKRMAVGKKNMPKPFLKNKIKVDRFLKNIQKPMHKTMSKVMYLASFSCQERQGVECPCFLRRFCAMPKNDCFFTIGQHSITNVKKSVLGRLRVDLFATGQQPVVHFGPGGPRGRLVRTD